MNKINYIAKLFAFNVLFAMIFCIATTNTFAGNGNKNSSKTKQAKLWQQIDESSLQSRRERSDFSSAKYLVFSLNKTAFKNLAAQAPLEFTEAARQNEVILEIPTPEGTIVRFRLEESPMLAPNIAAQFPTWKTYSGQGIDDPTATARFDYNINGFHGYVMGATGTFLIDPYSLSDQKNYIVYYKGNVSESSEPFTCNVGGNKTENAKLSSPIAPEAFSNGTQLRTYRLAVAATKEYTNFFGGNVNTAFGMVQTTVNRLIVIYRRELASTFMLVTGTSHVFTNANDGGYPEATNSMVADLSLPRNQIVMDMGNTANPGNPGPVGNANYDIGHVLSRTGNPNGLASSPSLCDPTAKAQGFTGAQVPQFDGFDVDYVAHEIGHQFAMSHTFNNDIDGSCSTRSTDSAYEPASGVTIMGYGGICAPRNLSANSIEYFNLRSFDQSLMWFQQIAGGVNGINPNCGTPTNNGNTPPVVTSPGNFTIPRLTPFTLTASATDANSDALTYLWEEFDLNVNGATGSVPNTTPQGGNPVRNNTDVDSDENGTIRPIFRAYNPSTSGSRTFPSLNYILNPANNDPAGSNQPSQTYMGTLPNAPTMGSTNGYVCAPTETCVRGERLPTIARIMNFRVTVRDNNAAGGGVADAQSTVTVVAAAGPFEVTTQNSLSNLAPAVTWQAGTMQNVTWNVAGTDANGINTAFVNILLSTDGGQTFPITILANTPNDNNQIITVPNNPTTTARIKVEAVGNIFFDINNANFAITSPTAASVSVAGRVLSSFGRGVSNAVVTSTDQNGVVRTVRTNPFGYYRFTDVAAGQTYVLGVRHKQYTFSPRVVSVSEDLSGFDFIAGN
jgi:hypothetical protein